MAKLKQNSKQPQSFEGESNVANSNPSEVNPNSNEINTEDLQDLINTVNGQNSFDFGNSKRSFNEENVHFDIRNQDFKELKDVKYPKSPMFQLTPGSEVVEKVREDIRKVQEELLNVKEEITNVKVELHNECQRLKEQINNVENVLKDAVRKTV